MEKNDIFDIIMEQKLFRPFEPFCRKYKEGLLYLFFGGLTFFLAIGVYVALNQVTKIGVLVANAVSWFAGITFSFFATRKWVFKIETSGLKLLFIQMIEFCVARIATFVLQEILLYIFIIMMRFDSILIKVCTEGINIMLNYLVSKFWVFKK